MAGIAGILGRALDHASTLDRMIRSLSSGPSDARGRHVDEELGIRIGWVGGSAGFVRGRAAGPQNVHLLFAGETFLDVDTLQGEGVRPSGDGDAADTQCLLGLYEAKGLEFLEDLNGWFSGLLVDRRTRTAVLFNDRYGLGRIYVHEAPDGLYFASEAKALLSVLPEARQLDMRGVGETISCGCVLQNRTLFPGIMQLPGGAKWTYRSDGTLAKDAYFDRAEWEGQTRLNGEAFYRAMRETMGKCVPRYFRGQQAIGMSLTGGLDGRMVLAWGKPAPATVPCYTFRGPFREPADATLARRLATHFGQPYQTIPVGEQFLGEFPSLAERTVWLSDGTMDVGGAVELYVNRFAREVAPVRMTGNYGSEILRTNVAFRPGRVDRALFSHDLNQQIAAAAATYGEERKGSRLSFIAFKQVPWHHFSRLSIEQSQLTVRSPFLDNDLVSLMFRAPSEEGLSLEDTLRLIADGNPGVADIPTDRGVVLHPPPIAGRLRHAVTELVVKAEYAYDYGMPQPLVRIDRSLRALHLERLFLGRHKFYHFRLWYRHQLAGFVRQILLDPESLRRPYLSRSGVERMVREHTEGRANHTLSIHRLLTLEILQRTLLEARV